MYHIGGEFQAVHKPNRGVPVAFERERHYAAASVRQIFFCQCMVGVAGKTWIVDPFHFFVRSQKFCHDLSIFTIPLHSDRKCLQSQVEQKCIDGSWICTKVPHQLYACLGNVGGFAKIAGIAYAVVGFIRFHQLREFTVIPRKVPAVYNHAAYLDSMPI